jgi:hypothetical protein
MLRVRENLFFREYRPISEAPGALKLQVYGADLAYAGYRRQFFPDLCRNIQLFTDLADPVALHDNAVEVRIRAFASDPLAPPGLALGVDLLVQVRLRARADTSARSASVMSSTPRTEIPARYISISVSSTSERLMRQPQQLKFNRH